MIFFGLSVALAGAPVGEASSPEGKISRAIRVYVAGRLSSSEDAIRVRLLRLPDEAFSKEDLLEVREGSEKGLLGRVVFRISSTRRDRPSGHRWVSAEVELLRPVVVPLRPLRRGHLFEASDLAVRTVPVIRSEEPYVDEPERLVGKRLTRSIGPGIPITFEMVEAAPVIRPGDRVTLLVETPGLRIAILGRAKEEGFPGKTVAVMNLDSKKVVYGEVVDAVTVRVHLPE